MRQSIFTSCRTAQRAFLFCILVGSMQRHSSGAISNFSVGGKSLLLSSEAHLGVKGRSFGLNARADMYRSAGLVLQYTQIAESLQSTERHHNIDLWLPLHLQSLDGWRWSPFIGFSKYLGSYKYPIGFEWEFLLWRLIFSGLGALFVNERSDVWTRFQIDYPIQQSANFSSKLGLRFESRGFGANDQGLASLALVTGINF